MCVCVPTQLFEVVRPRNALVWKWMALPAEQREAILKSPHAEEFYTESPHWPNTARTRAGAHPPQPHMPAAAKDSHKAPRRLQSSGRKRVGSAARVGPARVGSAARGGAARAGSAARRGFAPNKPKGGTGPVRGSGKSHARAPMRGTAYPRDHSRT